MYRILVGQNINYRYCDTRQDVRLFGFRYMAWVCSFPTLKAALLTQMHYWGLFTKNGIECIFYDCTMVAKNVIKPNNRSRVFALWFILTCSLFASLQLCLLCGCGLRWKEKKLTNWTVKTPQSWFEREAMDRPMIPKLWDGTCMQQTEHSSAPLAPCGSKWLPSWSWGRLTGGRWMWRPGLWHALFYICGGLSPNSPSKGLLFLSHL